ncbi:putative inactive receptor kinase, partial [Trifolium medium]|nr:putative inactive receptor kinase [Trifolium medium]
SRSARAKPLHWTSCLKIAEDVAHGLAYIHQVSSLIHGNLKSSNVLLGGKHPSKHPFLAPTDLQDWVKAMRDDDFSEDNRLEMLTEVASICSATSPEQRPAMWQVLKMIQGIKDSVSMEDIAPTGLS